MSSNEWREVQLSDVTDILGDGLHGTPEYDDNGEYYFINGNNLNGNIVIDDKTKKVNYKEYLKNKKNLNDRTILVSINGTLGKVALYNDEKVILGKSACYFNVMEDVDKYYIMYIMKSDYFRQYFRNYATGTTIKNLGLKQMREFPFLLPPFKEQKAIADTLSCLDDMIELNNCTNQVLEEMAQAIFNNWFVDFEFPNEDGRPYKSSGGEMLESELGEIPKGWRVVELKELCNHIKPGTNSQPKRTEWGIPFLNVKNINKGYIDTTESNHISKEDYDIVHKSWKPEINDLLISRIGTLGLVAVIRKEDLPIVVHYNFIDIKPEILPYQLMYFLLKSNCFQQSYQLIKKQSVQEYVTIDDVEKLKITIPINMKDIDDISLLFCSLYEKIYINQKQNQTLTAIHDTLLPKLMSGEIRVPIEEVV